MLHVDAKMIRRLDEIEGDLAKRRERANDEGEIEGIDLTLSFLRTKREEAARIHRRTTHNTRRAVGRTTVKLAEMPRQRPHPSQCPKRRAAVRIKLRSCWSRPPSSASASRRPSRSPASRRTGRTSSRSRSGTATMSPAHPRADDDDHARNRSSSQRNASGSSIGTRCPTPGISSSGARSAVANEPARKSGRSYSPAASRTPGRPRRAGRAPPRPRPAAAQTLAAASRSPAAQRRRPCLGHRHRGRVEVAALQRRLRGPKRPTAPRTGTGPAAGSRPAAARSLATAQPPPPATPPRRRTRSPRARTARGPAPARPPRVLRPGPHRRLAEPRQVGCDRAEPRQRQYVRPHRAVRHARVLQHQRWTNTHLVVRQCHGSRRYATVVAISLETTIAR